MAAILGHWVHGEACGAASLDPDWEVVDAETAAILARGWFGPLKEAFFDS